MIRGATRAYLVLVFLWLLSFVGPLQWACVAGTWGFASISQGGVIYFRATKDISNRRYYPEPFVMPLAHYNEVAALSNEGIKRQLWPRTHSEESFPESRPGIYDPNFRPSPRASRTN
jgi:hypothetical protein